MKTALIIIAFVGAYFAVDMFAGVVSPVLGPLVVTLAIFGAVYIMVKLSQDGR
jgi:hypothetical protein